MPTAKPPSEFGIMHPYCLLSKYLKRIWGQQENLGKAEIKVLRDLTEKSVNFSALVTFDVQLSLIFGKVDQQTKLVRSVKKNHCHRRKTQENDSS